MKAKGKRGRGTRKRGTWEALWFVTGPDGQRQMQSKSGFATEREAHEHRMEQLQALRKGTYVSASRETVGVYLARWIEGRRDALRPTTFASYKMLIDSYIVPEIGGVVLQALRPQHLTSLYATLRERGRKRDGKALSKRTVRYCHVVLSRALRDAERWSLIPRNPAQLVEAPGTEASRRACWTVEEAVRFLDATATQRLGSLWRLAIASGARRGELLAATWDDLDGAGLRIERALVVVNGRVRVSPPKTNRGTRFVPLDDETLGVLREHRRRQIEERLAAGEAWEAKPLGLDLIFRDELGRPIRPQRVLRAFQAASKAAGVPVVPFHSARHFTAVMHARAGTSPTIAAEILGHDVRLLQGVYQLHAQPDLAAAAVRRVASALRGG